LHNNHSNQNTKRTVGENDDILCEESKGSNDCDQDSVSSIESGHSLIDDDGSSGDSVIKKESPQSCQLHYLSYIREAHHFLDRSYYDRRIGMVHHYSTILEAVKNFEYRQPVSCIRVGEDFFVFTKNNTAIQCKLCDYDCS
jgi:hypothetical protein